MPDTDIDAEPLTWREFVQAHLHEVELPPRGETGTLVNFDRSNLRARQLHDLGARWQKIKRLRAARAKG